MRPILFKIDPERIHDLVCSIGVLLGRFSITRILLRLFFRYENPALVQIIDGISYPNPIGLSAGFDKEVKLANVLPQVGFGFMQMGSITLKAYAGNRKPRLYRLPKSKGLVVYYGLKNLGVSESIKRLKKIRKYNFPISISIAKTNSNDSSTVDGGVDDYFKCMKEITRSGVGDLITLNISCPNAFGGEPYTTPDKLRKLLEKIEAVKTTKPRYVKMPIDLPWKEFKGLLDVILEYNLEGVVIANLTKDRTSELILDEIPDEIEGGISGHPTSKLTDELIRQTYEYCGQKITIVGVGGIFNAEDAYRKIKLGASLIQLITGLIYEGPQLVAEMNKDLVRLLKKDGYKNISEAVGSAL